MAIEIKGARENNLKDVNVEIGAGLTAVTGVSGSGKSSLVFDTLYHEARRRLLDVISTGSAAGWQYQLTPARVESVTGLGPALAVGQNVLNRNPNSTLASAAGLSPFLRLLYTHYGERRCSICGESLRVFTEDEMVAQLLSEAKGRPAQVLAPLMRGVKGSHRTLLELLAAEFGTEALYVDGTPGLIQLPDPGLAHDLEVALGWLDPDSTNTGVRQLVRQAAALGAQAITLVFGTTRTTLGSAPVCTLCGAWFDRLEPKHFHQACPHCTGRGCEKCDETGMFPLAAGVRWAGQRLPLLLTRSVSELHTLFTQADFPETAGRLRGEITRRLAALDRVGLGYVALDRPSPTLSRGESQRVRLAVSLISPLEDMLHVLDEPTIGQHPADVARLLPAFRELPGPVLYVEHDRVAVAAADRVIDLGPGAGREGGEVVFEGTPAGLWLANTATGAYFSHRRRPTIPARRRKPETFLSIQGASRHNLQEIDIAIPAGRLTVISGVSGSGKSTLAAHVLAPSLKQQKPVGCRRVEGPPMKVVLVDQSPIGRNPRSNPATYTKLSDIIRELFAEVSGLSPSHFSFNRPEGACPTCKGMGALETTMRFLASVWIPCPDCAGRRFNEDVLATRIPFGHRRLSVAGFYDLSIAEASTLLAGESRLRANWVKAALRILRALTDVGLGYLPLGQPSPSLSGGEAQRVKISKYLGRAGLAGRLLIFDEPSTGLHPQDLDGLLLILDRLAQAGATIVVIEHNSDIIRAADWVIDLGPGSGPEGGQVLYAGPPEGLSQTMASLTGQALKEEQALRPRSGDGIAAVARPATIKIVKARANNLKGVDVEIPKGKLTVVTGVSGSGKSSLVGNVLEVEARRRYLESLSMYERQGTREGPEALVEEVTGLGVTLTLRSQMPHLWSSLAHFTRRASVGNASELTFALAVLLSEMGRRSCLACGSRMSREKEWICPVCGARAPVLQPRHFSTQNYASACTECTGMGLLFEPRPEKLIIYPDKPLCNGAMYSPGYWPQSYFCKDTGISQALGARYGFDPLKTPWQEMSDEARQVFLFGDEEEHEFLYQSKGTRKMVTRVGRWEGFYGGWVRDWDVHGTYTEQAPCPKCQGAGLKESCLAVTLDGHNIHALSEMPLVQLKRVLDGLVLDPVETPRIGAVLSTARKRVRFLQRIGLDYLHLNRPAGTLSAGEAQRLQLAALLGSELTSLTILLDEPSRGMHPQELDALRETLEELRDQGNTLVVVEHDLLLIRAADHLIDMGPGAGTAGGQVVAAGSPEEVAGSHSLTGKWLRGHRQAGQDEIRKKRREAGKWLVITGASENNLRGETVHIPLGLLTGICGVSGSGKSTLLVDTIGRALAPKSHTTSFAHEPLEPGKFETIAGAPARTILVDQAQKGIQYPAAFLGLTKPLLTIFAAGADAQALGLDAKQLGRRCSACKGRGLLRTEMAFLPDLYTECETCRGTGCIPEAWQVRVKGVTLPEVNGLTLAEAYTLFEEQEKIAWPLKVALEVGLGYLVWRQPAHSLSGGETQRLKIARELSRRLPEETLFILDEPTVGLHMEDVQLLIQVLDQLVGAGHSVVLLEHHPHVLAACDWLIELGPGGGPEGGRIIAAGTPESVAAAETPTAPYLAAVLEGVI